MVNYDREDPPRKRPHLTLALVRAYGSVRGEMSNGRPLDVGDVMALHDHFGVDQTCEDRKIRLDVQTEFKLGFRDGASKGGVS